MNFWKNSSQKDRKGFTASVSYSRYPTCSHTLSITPKDSFICSSLIVKGGANRIIFPCVGFASNPLSFMARQTSQALPKSAYPSLGWSITIAFRKPLPRTFSIQVLPSNEERSYRNCLPRERELSDSFSSRKTSSVAVATLHAGGFPP